ncbi:hypothetical protein TYRP_023420 [Tyrophagus putrescentiae]|nr:hypothetical protein TYRP_023420 [Tyrophagus putrescentiae]
MSFLLTFAYPPRHPSFTPVTLSDRQALARVAIETGAVLELGDLEVDAQMEAMELNHNHNHNHNHLNNFFPSAADTLPPIQAPPTFKRNGRKLLMYKAVLVTVNLSVILGLLLFYLFHEGDANLKKEGRTLIFGWIPRESLLIPISLAMAAIEAVLIVGLLRDAPPTRWPPSTSSPRWSTLWSGPGPLCCDLLLYPLACHISLLYVLELNRLERGSQAWKGYIQAHLARRRQVMQLDMEMQEQQRRRERQLFDEVSL